MADDHPEILITLYNFIRDAGHTCMLLIKGADKKSHLIWCETDACEEMQNIDKINKINNHVITYGRELQTNGHKCIQYIHTSPIQIKWCKNNEQCTMF